MFVSFKAFDVKGFNVHNSLSLSHSRGNKYIKLTKHKLHFWDGIDREKETKSNNDTINRGS